MRKGGSDSASILLIIIIAIVVIIAWIGIILLIVFAIFGIISGIITIIKYFKEKKRLALEAKEEYEKTLMELENEMTECKKMLGKDPQAIFIQSYLEILPYKIELLKGEYMVKYGKISKSEKEELIIQNESNIQFIAKHKTEIDYNMPSEMQNAFTDLCRAIEKVRTSCQIWKVDNRKGIQSYNWGSHLHRKELEFKKEYFNDVAPYDGSVIYSINIDEVKFYFYPDNIIEAKSPISYILHQYPNLSSILRDNIVVEDKGSIRGGTICGFTYLHTRMDGGPDLRYSYNPQYPKIRYGYLHLSPINTFQIDISNWNCACNLNSSLNKMKPASMNYNRNTYKDIPSNVSNNDPISSNFTENNLIDSGIHEIFQKIIIGNGINVITDASFINILDDHHAFARKPYLKNIIKTLQKEGYAKRISNNNINFNDSEKIIIEISEKFLLEEKYVRELFCYLLKPLSL